MSPEIPDKLYFKIGEVAKLADVPPHVLRYWESEFTAIKPKRANSGQRLYKRADVEKVLHIKILLHEQGFTIAGAKKLLKSGKQVKLTTSPAAESTQNTPGRETGLQSVVAGSSPVPGTDKGFQPFLKRLKQELTSLQHLLDSDH